jgi:hypothetical protein
MKWVLPSLVPWAQCDTFILPWLLWSARYKIFFFLTIHYLIVCVPIAQQPGQAVVQGLLSLNCVSGSQPNFWYQACKQMKE